MADYILMTKEGYNQLLNELKKLKEIERPATVQALEEARQMGDLRENAEYHAAKEKLALIDSRIAEIEYRLSKAKIVEKSSEDGKVGFGSKVKVFNYKLNKEQVYTIVSSDEMDLKSLKISIESPIGKALIGHEEGDEVIVQIPSGEMKLKILKIE